ncbi:MAG: glucose 1-dehydrogenase [Rhodothermia bacterium]|nr:glucose 1-dehydrogenase [Rhodothermia bacterium]
MKRRLEGKRAVVTGGSNGIGRAITEAFVDAGAAVLFTAYSDITAAEALVETGRAKGASIGFVQLDAGEPDNVEVLHEAAISFLDTVDVLVNNAATMTRSLFLDISEEEYDRIMAVNLRFPFFVTQRFARHMIDNGISGSIINVSSISDSSAVSKMAHYQCSKAGLTMLTRGAAYELAGHGIRVNTVAPGLTATNANRNQWEGDPDLWRRRSENIPLGRPGVAADHAGAAIFLASDESSWMTGATLVIDGGSMVV